MEIINDPIDVEILDNSINAQINEVHSVCIEDNTDLDITVQKKEFVITGDDVFIYGSGQETPAWIIEMINDHVTNLTSIRTTELNEAISSINQALLALDVAKNKYTESIMTEETINGIVVSHTSTLNATVQDNSASIINLDRTKATPDEALTLSINHMHSQIKDGEIHSLITDINTTVANDRETAATSIGNLTSTYNDNKAEVRQILSTEAGEYSVEANAITEMKSAIYDADGEVQGIATAQEDLYTYVGVNNTGTGTGTGILADVEMLQKQNDGVIETFTNTYDVILNALEDPDTDDELVLNAEPYVKWAPKSGTCTPAYTDELNGTVYEDLSDATYYEVVNSKWEVVTADRYTEQYEFLRTLHIGDVYIKYSLNDNGTKEYIASYKFVKTIPDETSPYATDVEGYTWAVIVDQAAQDAYISALNAWDLAAGKRTIYSDPTTLTGPAGEDRDIWIPTTGTHDTTWTPKEIYQHNGSEWILATGYTEDLNNFVYTIEGPGGLREQVDGKIEYYFQLSTDANPDTWDETDDAKHNGDTLHYTDTNESYYFDGDTGVWGKIQDQDALDAIEDAAGAQATADGKVNHYYAWYSNGSPTTEYQYWIKTDNKIYHKVGTAWIDMHTSGNYALDAGDLALVWDSDEEDHFNYYYNGSSWSRQTTEGLVAKSGWAIDIDAYLKNVDGSYFGGESSIETYVETTADGQISTAFEYGSIIAKDGVNYTTGFGLNSFNEANGSSEFWINAEKFRFTNNNGDNLINGDVFTIEGTDVKFNGVVSFTNATDTDGYSNSELTSAINSAAATANWSQVTDDGNRPADGADVTSANTALGIANQGALATQNRSDLDFADGADVTDYLDARIDNTVAYQKASELAASATGVLPAYSNLNPNTLTFVDGILSLDGLTDSTTGMVFPAFRVNLEPEESWNIQFNYRADVDVSSGFYFRVYEYDNDLPTGKTHISNDAGNSDPRVVEDTRQASGLVGGKENTAVTTTFSLISGTYTPTATAKYASIVLLNWAGMDLNRLDITGWQVTRNTTVQDVLNHNTTVIDGGRITTGTITSNNYSYTSGDYATAGTEIDLNDGRITSENFNISATGTPGFKGTITGSTAVFDNANDVAQTATVGGIEYKCCVSVVGGPLDGMQRDAGLVCEGKDYGLVVGYTDHTGGGVGIQVEPASYGTGIWVDATTATDVVGIKVYSTTSTSAYMNSTEYYGIYTETASTTSTHAAIAAEATNAAYGGYFIANSGYGVHTTTDTGSRALQATNNNTGSATYQHSIEGKTSGDNGCGVIGESTSGAGVGVLGITADATGHWGLKTDNSAYIGGTTYPFTGAHFTLTKEVVPIGDIVIATDALGVVIHQAYPYTEVATVTKDKRVFGVTSLKNLNLLQYALTTQHLSTTIEVPVLDAEGNEQYDEDEELITTKEQIIKPEYAEFIDGLVANGYKLGSVNAIGEGMINICEAGGDIESGDYICSSNVAGKGQKQDDDLLHNYTVAKALGPVLWANEVVGEDRCFEFEGVKCKMIACTYHCG